VRHLLEDDEVFLANYGDVLTDAPLNQIIEDFIASDATASMLAVPPQESFHVVEIGDDCRVTDIESVANLPLWENGGYFVLRQGVFDVLHRGEDLVTDAFPRLADQRRLKAVKHTGFWAPMDTLKERSLLEELHRSGKAPWKLWARTPNEPEPRFSRPTATTAQPVVRA
jgi:glucose-1-phosphate cytidylyltransferase